MIHQLNFNGQDKVEVAIERLKTYEPEEGYFLCFSGGKDSCVIKALADMAEVKYDAHYAVASVDPPELVRFIKDEHPDVIFDYPRYKDGTVCTMWNLIPKKTMPPTRIVRYCCAYLKENNGHGGGRLKVTGVRWAESVKRKKMHGVITIPDKKAKRYFDEEHPDITYKLTPQGGVALSMDNRENAKTIEMCYKTHSTTLNPIVDWDDGEVWEFIKEYKVPYCKLYDEGFKRLGCIGCPMGSAEQRRREFERWSKYKDLYLKAFEKMIENRVGGGRARGQHQYRRGLYDGNAFADGEFQSPRGHRDFTEMTPEEIVDWWID